jgi:hypothetical protein
MLIETETKAAVQSDQARKISSSKLAHIVQRSPHYKTTLERYKTALATHMPDANEGPTTSLYCRKPGKNQLELQIEDFDTETKSVVFFASEGFATKLIGVEFDPGDIARRLQDGESEALLKQLPSSGLCSLDSVSLC